VTGKRHILIEPSILSADFARLGEQVREAEAAGAKAVQIDVMDGHFVPNLTFGPGIVKALRPSTHIMLDVHLMIENPDSFLRNFAAAGADRIIVHQEACPHPDRTLRAIRDLSLQAGIALNPETAVGTLEGILEWTDVIQIMTVHPGFGGQEFMPAALEKIRRVGELLCERSATVPIAVDGGIDPGTAPLAVSAGASILVAGSAVYNRNGSVKDNFLSLLSAAQGGISVP
jgi:ribulose-phosphate 3-epimerase